MDDTEIYEEASKLGKYLLYLNAIFIVLIALTYGFLNIEYATYIAIFFFIELIILVALYLPTFIYYLIKGNSPKLSSSKAMLAFGDFYSYLTPW